VASTTGLHILTIKLTRVGWNLEREPCMYGEHCRFTQQSEYGRTWDADLHVDSDVNGGTGPGYEIAGLKYSTIFILRRVFSCPQLCARLKREKRERKLLTN
jgi:hypothetical protein